MDDTDPSRNHRFELHLDIDTTGVKPLDILSTHCALSRSTIKQAITDGALWLEDRHGIRRIRRTARELVSGDKLHLYYDATVLAERPTTAELISDEGDYSVWNKPYGMRSQGSKWGDHCTITRWAELHLDPPRDAWLVHRLDRPTRGLMLVAHRRKTASALSELFASRHIEKHYRAIVHGQLQVSSPISVEADVDGKPAHSILLSSQYDADDDESTVLVKILSGRKHQVRRHLASLGHAVVGDRLHGEGDQTRDLQLTACHLAFTCPVSGDSKRFTLHEGR